MTRRLSIHSLLVLSFVLGLAAPAVAESPWALLTELRQGLIDAGPTTARFEQTFLPAGFDDGTTEKGHVSLQLPRCLRWNYTDPEAKHFLLCEDEVWFWNDLDPAGRHYRIDPENEPGLDLLLVDVDRLRERYVAESDQRDDGTWDIRLATPTDAVQPFHATLRVDPVADRMIEFQYTDAEGNQTRFVITDYQPLQHTALFQAPVDIEWTDG
ncbi:MAG: outer membrane lipoprotein carrier protein LolA [Acidobacteriota bacterium]